MNRKHNPLPCFLSTVRSIGCFLADAMERTEFGSRGPDKDELGRMVLIARAWSCSRATVCSFSVVFTVFLRYYAFCYTFLLR